MAGFHVWRQEKSVCLSIFDSRATSAVLASWTVELTGISLETFRYERLGRGDESSVVREAFPYRRRAQDC